MPEGPSLVIAKEAIKHFVGKKVIKANGYAKIDMDRLYGQKILDIKTWGKHLLLCFKGFAVQVHFMLFGSYLIDETKKINPKLHLHFAGKDLYFYMTNVHIIEGEIEDAYDFGADIMNEKWDAKAAKNKLKEKPAALVCDALLDQQIFSGSGNIIKNEVLYRAKIQPQSTVGALPAAKLTALVREVPKFAFDFLKWKMKNQLTRHLQVYEKKECPTCHGELEHKKIGKGKRPTYWCGECQVRY